MKKFLIGITMVTFLSGCGVEDSQLDDMLNMMAEDTELAEHLSSLSFDLREGEEFEYEDDLTGELLSSFDKLSPEEQNNFFIRLNEIAVENNGDPEYGSFFCGEDYECTINDIVLKTKNHTYTKSYANNGEGDIFSDLYKDSEIIYDEGEEDGIPVTEPVEEVGETEDLETEEEPIEVTEDVTTIDITTADGNDWVKLTSDEKHDLINEALNNIKSHGTVVSAEADWFVEALDAFYGDDVTNSTLVKEAIAMSGVAGGVIE